MKKLSYFLLIGLVGLALSGCSKDDDELLELSSGPPPVETLPPVPKEPPKPLELKRYNYPYTEARDPFAPLVGGAPTPYAAGKDSASNLLQNFANLQLRGILRDKRGKMALITSTDGESYTLRSGRVFDRRNRMINGVSGIIKEGSVVLISKNKMVKELILARKDDKIAPAAPTR